MTDIQNMDDWLEAHFATSYGYSIVGEFGNIYSGSGTNLPELTALAQNYFGLSQAAGHTGWDTAKLQQELANGYPVVVEVYTHMLRVRRHKHYMVLVGMDDKFVYVNDPDRTNGADVSYPIGDFLDAWQYAGNNAVVVIHPNQQTLGSFDAGGWSGNDYVYDWLPFTPTITGAVTSVNTQFFECGNGQCVGPAYYVICAVNGGHYGSCPAGSILATSDATTGYPVSPNTGSQQFSFSGANQITLNAGETYYVQPYVNGGQGLAGGLQTFTGVPSTQPLLSQTDFSYIPGVIGVTDAWELTLQSTISHVGHTTMSVQNFDAAYLGWNCTMTAITNIWNAVTPPCVNLQQLNVIGKGTLPNGAPFYVFDSNADISGVAMFYFVNFYSTSVVGAGTDTQLIPGVSFSSYCGGGQGCSDPAIRNFIPYIIIEP